MISSPVQNSFERRSNRVPRVKLVRLNPEHSEQPKEVMGIKALARFLLRPSVPTLLLYYRGFQATFDRQPDMEPSAIGCAVSQ